MSITSKLSSDGSELTIEIHGRFDFSAHQQFRDAYEKCSPPPSKYIIDMQDTNYLDSSALGMLLLLRDYAGGDSSEININNCSDEVRKILSISNFEQLFEIGA